LLRVARRGRVWEPVQGSYQGKQTWFDAAARGGAESASFVRVFREPLAFVLLLLALLVTVPAAADPPVPPAVSPAPADAGAPADARRATAPARAAQAEPARATDTDTETAEHVAQGKRLYLLGRYQEAIAEYRRAYELRADPQFLFDAAEAYRELGASDQALFYYHRYLAAAPRAPNREVVEDRVSELELLLAPAPSAPPAPQPPAGAKAKPTPVWRRWWLWTAVGLALGASITAAAVTSRPSPTMVPASDLGDHKFY
jgi:tetratricopeptide (TPR) repeat protein